jgi:hypothetical protein
MKDFERESVGDKKKKKELQNAPENMQLIVFSRKTGLSYHRCLLKIL